MFLDLLATIRPREELVRLFREIVIDVWRERHEETVRDRKTLEKRLQDLQDKKTKLLEAHLYKQILSSDEFLGEKDRLDSEAALVRLELHETMETEYDVEGIVGFAERVLLDAPRLWEQYGLDQKQRFQKLIFPKEIEFDGDGIRTAPTCSMFTYLRQIGAGSEHLAFGSSVDSNGLRLVVESSQTMGLNST